MLLSCMAATDAMAEYSGITRSALIGKCADKTARGFVYGLKCRNRYSYGICNGMSNILNV